MNREAGKGSKQRPFSVSRDKFDSNWERTFSKPVRLENPLNQEVWYCDNFNETHSVDGVEYIKVYKIDNPKRTNLMRKSALQKISR